MKENTPKSETLDIVHVSQIDEALFRLSLDRNQKKAEEVLAAIKNLSKDINQFVWPNLEKYLYLNQSDENLQEVVKIRRTVKNAVYLAGLKRPEEVDLQKGEMILTVWHVYGLSVESIDRLKAIDVDLAVVDRCCSDYGIRVSSFPIASFYHGKDEILFPRWIPNDVQKLNVPKDARAIYKLEDFEEF